MTGSMIRYWGMGLIRDSVLTRAPERSNNQPLETPLDPGWDGARPYIFLFSFKSPQISFVG